MTDVADLAHWQMVAKALGWSVYGWTHQNSAAFRTDERNYITLTGKQAADIMAAIEAARQQERDRCCTHHARCFLCDPPEPYTTHPDRLTRYTETHGRQRRSG